MNSSRMANETDSRAWRARTVRACAILSGLLLFSQAHAAYNYNMQGTVESLHTYTAGLVLIILSNQPTANGGCNASYFELDPPGVTGADTVNDAAFNRMYARVAQAYATGEQVNIGFDNTGTCGAWGYIRVYEIG
jgi:hypothetical protein